MDVKNFLSSSLSKIHFLRKSKVDFFCFDTFTLADVSSRCALQNIWPMYAEVLVLDNAF